MGFFVVLFFGAEKASTKCVKFRLAVMSSLSALGLSGEQMSEVSL